MVYFSDELAPNDRDFTYLDYVKAREREYEYAMHLRDAMRREENGYRRVDENDDFDEDTVDEQERLDDDDDDDEEGNEDRYGKMKRGLKKEERLKEQIIDRKDHHNKANYDKGKLRDVKVGYIVFCFEKLDFFFNFGYRSLRLIFCSDSAK